MDYVQMVNLFYVEHDDWSDEFVQTLVTKGKITQEEYEQAKATRQERVDQQTQGS